MDVFGDLRYGQRARPNGRSAPPPYPQ